MTQSAKKKEMVRNYCSECARETKHEVVGKHEETSDPDTYHCMTEHAVVKCLGCEHVSFRKAFHDYEASYPGPDGDWHHPIEVEIYPRMRRGRLDLSDAPTIVENIYTEACNAFDEEFHTLAGIGFRATIEAICNDQKVTGKDLSSRISSLAVKGLISKKDSTRLHSIRFLGNDAAHEIKKPSTDNLDAALTIIEHLLTTVYILDNKTKGKLEEVIDAFGPFEKLLLSKLDDFSIGDEYPIQKYLGKDIRLLHGSRKHLEGQLISKISKGTFTRLAIGVNAAFQNSKEALQHFIVK